MQARHREDETPPGASVHGPWVIEKEDAAGERTVWLPEDLQVRGCNVDRTVTNREQSNGLLHWRAYGEAVMAHTVHRYGFLATAVAKPCCLHAVGFSGAPPSVTTFASSYTMCWSPSNQSSCTAHSQTLQ